MKDGSTEIAVRRLSLTNTDTWQNIIELAVKEAEATKQYLAESIALHESVDAQLHGYELVTNA